MTANEKVNGKGDCPLYRSYQDILYTVSSMITLDFVKNLVGIHLSRRAETIGIQLRIIEDEIEEHEWGWVIYWEPIPTLNQNIVKMPISGLPYLVDKVNSRVRTVGTYGLKISISKLLKSREG